MLSKFFFAQWNYPGKKNEWTQTVKEDLASLEITCNLSQIKKMSKESFKNFVGDKCRIAAFNHLIKLKDSHSKLKDLKYNDLCLQPYFYDGSFSSNDARLLFLFRTRMVRVYNNYKNMYADTLCPLCRDHADTQEHLLACIKLPPSTSPYIQIFGTSTAEMKSTFFALKTALTVRQKLLAVNDDGKTNNSE